MSGFIVGLITAIHIGVCISLMAAILLQSGKGGGLAGTFGAGSSQTLFGGRGAATFLSRATTTLAVVFFLTSLTLGFQATRSASAGRSLIQEEARRHGQQREATGGAPTSGAPTNAPSAGPPSPSTPVPGMPAPAHQPSSGTSKPAPGQALPLRPPGAPAGGGAQAPATGGK